ncbi:family 16 glycosylhydrolase [Aporhodopirellula aestuarii]|uniref:Family 16 glycosylhydrolase n=1 Tax=Aporhodopirellula aestuarii TaxID=2950107 RepID=A0ABT0TZ07_9BACT|nr:family 16 glycosylhydrolase [Aporhodopirellula aestuarii]MCM2369832.1 family 16 glycosylhydrolase [Aporhodopirellula aestuarii]
MSMFVTTIASLVVVAVINSNVPNSNRGTTRYEAAIKHIENLPEPPEGFRWAVNPDFTDEFSGETLDQEKWFAKSPYWTNGRPPATFKADNVSLKDGFLRIRNRRLIPSEGNDGTPGDKYTLAGGAVASRSDQAWYGYYETRMKASATPMSSTFWLKNMPRSIRYVTEEGRMVKESHRQELDIIETIGTPTRPENWNRQFHANTHYQVNVGRGQDPPTVSVGAPKNSTTAIENTAEDFHTYAVWWVDPNTMHFYYDGKFLFTVNPGTDYNLLPFARPMYMHLVTETYDWEPGLPTDEMLNDEQRNSTLYDWVRSYILVRK